MSSLLRILASSAIALCLCFSATAQVSKIQGSGCQGLPFPSSKGQPALGKQFAVGCPVSIDRMQVLVGFPTQQPLVINMPIMCINKCMLAVNPVFLTLSSTWTVTIPINSSLVGAPLVAQCLQTSLNRTCLILTGALGIRIMP